MASIIETHLQCDVCNDTFGVDNRFLNTAQQRESAKQNGWIYSGGKDYCPSCRARTKNGSIHKPKPIVRRIMNVGPHHSMPNT